MIRLLSCCALLLTACVFVEAQTIPGTPRDESAEAPASPECVGRKAGVDSVFAEAVAARPAEDAPPPKDARRSAPTPVGAEDGGERAKTRGAEGANAKGCAGASEAPQQSARVPSGIQPPPPARDGFGDEEGPDNLEGDEATDSLVDDEATAAAADIPDAPRGFRWKSALEQSFLMLAIQHGYALTQPKTRRELRGPFFKDYFRSVRSLHGWADGGRFFTNYIAHPLQGATAGFIQVQNDPKGMRLRFGRDAAYWRSRFKAFGWSAIHSTQFELGPLSQASIGNVGMNKKLTYVDLVITPTLGTGLLIAEDALDRYVVRRIEGRSDNLYLRIVARTLLNPARSCANLFRFKKPWHRDNR